MRFTLLFQILEKIFCYFDVDERKELSVVCKRWLNVAFSYHFAKECPLTIELNPGTKAKRVFSQTKSFRNFPCVQISNRYEKRIPKYGYFPKRKQLTDEVYKTMRQIGKTTSHLDLIHSFIFPLALNYFPKLSQLNLLNLNDIVEFDSIPTTLETVCVKTAKRWVSCDNYVRIKSLKHIKYLYCEKVDLAKDETKGFTLSLFELTKDLDHVLQNYAIDKQVEVSSNLWIDKEIDFCDIAALTLLEDFREFDQLLKFSNLKVRDTTKIAMEKVNCKKN